MGVPSLATVFDVFDVWGVASQSRFDFEDPKHVTQVVNPTIFPFLGKTSPAWAHLSLPGQNFPCMGTSSPSWAHLPLHGHIFPSMGTSSRVWPWGLALFDGNLASLGVSLGIAKAIARDSCMCRHVSACVTAASHTHAKSRLLLPHRHLTQ